MSAVQGAGNGGTFKEKNSFQNKLLKNRDMVANGLSLNGTTIQTIKKSKEDSDVRCIITVENWSMFTLLDVETNNECGKIQNTFRPRNVFPGYREVFVAHQGNPLMGTCGTVSWQIVEVNIRLIVMWSVPFNFNMRDSYFGIGLVFNNGKFTTSNYWFNQMYYGSNGAHKRSLAGKTIKYQNKYVVVHGFMEANTYHPLLNISVIPQKRFNLAGSIQRKLYHRERAEYINMDSSGVESVAKGITSLLTFILFIITSNM